jgi:hypothetical protein
MVTRCSYVHRLVHPRTILAQCAPWPPCLGGRSHRCITCSQVCCVTLRARLGSHPASVHQQRHHHRDKQYQCGRLFPARAVPPDACSQAWVLFRTHACVFQPLFLTHSHDPPNSHTAVSSDCGMRVRIPEKTPPPARAVQDKSTGASILVGHSAQRKTRWQTCGHAENRPTPPRVCDHGFWAPDSYDHAITFLQGPRLVVRKARGRLASDAVRHHTIDLDPFPTIGEVLETRHARAYYPSSREANNRSNRSRSVRNTSTFS